jgi:hypothetical protein
MSRAIFLLDSGAYSVSTKGITINIETFASFINENRPLFKGGIFNLDVLSDPAKSYDNWLQLKSLGAETIPVYHHGEDVKWLHKYLDNCVYVGIGAIANLSTDARIETLDLLWKNHLTDFGGEPRCALHGLGLTSPEVMLRYPWFSVDSSSAVKQAAFGGVLIPSFRKGVPDFNNMRILAVSSKSTKHNIGTISSFHTKPPRAKEEILNYITSFGFTIDDDLSQSVPENGLFQPCSDPARPEKPRGVRSPNLSIDWVARLEFNLKVMGKFLQFHRKQGKHIRLYQVTSGSSLLKEVTRIMENSEFVQRYLVSYYGMGKAMVSAIKEAQHGSRTGSSGRSGPESHASNLEDTHL